MARVATASPWIEAQRFDLAVFFAPAGLSLLAFVSCVVLGAPPLVWLWAWLICFDGPHMLATYSRAYGDLGLWRSRKRLLLGSWLAFAVGPALLLLDAWLGLPGIFTVFLAGMSVYSFHHVVRQHWGFASLYGARAAATTTGSAKPRSGNLRFWFYGVCWAPYVAFILSHPSLAREVAASSSLRQAGELAALALFGFWLVGIARFARLMHSVWRQQAPRQQPAYLLLAALFHGLLFFLVARFEPVLPGAVGLDQQFMLLSAMNGMFHSAQYLGLVGLFHQRSAHVSSPPTWFANRPGRAWGVLLLFVLLYVAVACATGVYPGCQVWLGRQLHHVGFNQLALAIWWGFALHHYWLDERIWHVRSDPQLRAVFGLGSLR